MRPLREVLKEFLERDEFTYEDVVDFVGHYAPTKRETSQILRSVAAEVGVKIKFNRGKYKVLRE